MHIQQRSYADARDQPEMIQLAHAAMDEHLHVIDLPYRFSSWALDDPANGSLWMDERGRLAGWAVLQAPFWTLDFAVEPGLEGLLLPLILGWADERAANLANTLYDHPMWFANVFANQHTRTNALRAAGYADQAHVSIDPWSKVLLRLTQPPVVASLAPEGFTVRSLRGVNEVDIYVRLHQAVFESKNMTREWRLRTLQQPAYRPELDLVVEAPDGSLVGFCIGWYATDGMSGVATGQIEPLGIQADFRKMGLAHALLDECVRRIFALGASQVLVETDAFRDAAYALYTNAGFAVHKDVRVYRKDM